MTFRTFSGVFVLSLLAIVAGCHAEPKALPIAPLTLEELIGEWNANKDVTLAKYKDTLLEISGTVSMATCDTTVTLPMVRLTNDAADKSKRVFVRCLFLYKDAPRINRVCEGQTATVRGQLIDADSKEPTLLNCELIEAGASPALVLSLQELADEYKADKKKMGEKYNSRWMIVEGFVGAIDRPKVKKFDLSKDAPSVEIEDEHCYRYYFKHDDDKTVRISAVCCSFHNNTLLKRYATIAVGQKIKVRGRCDRTVWREANGIELTQSVLLDD